MIYVLNRDRFGHGEPVQRFQATRPCRVECKEFYDASGVNRLAYWNSRLYVWGWNDVLRDYRLRGSVFDTTPEAKAPFARTFPAA